MKKVKEKEWDAEEDMPGCYLAMVDYTYHHAAKKSLVRVLTRPVHDQSTAEVYADMELDELRKAKNQQSMAYRKVYVVKIIKVIEIRPDLQYKPKKQPRRMLDLNC